MDHSLLPHLSCLLKVIHNLFYLIFFPQKYVHINLNDIYNNNRCFAPKIHFPVSFCMLKEFCLFIILNLPYILPPKKYFYVNFFMLFIRLIFPSVWRPCIHLICSRVYPCFHNIALLNIVLLQFFVCFLF